MIDSLFVYGTLCPGEINERILSTVGGIWQRASVKGYLHGRGWGKTMGYPAVVLDERGELINGYLFTSKRLVDHWPRLDAFEGKAYRRAVAQVRTEADKWLTAHIYVLDS